LKEADVKYALICAAFLAAGCAQTPTSPTTTGASAGLLRWDVVAPGCGATSAPTPTPDVTTARMRQEADGSMTASWNYELKGRPVLLIAHFVEVGGVWGMCSWDTSDV
jgi:hypothetical protein